MPERLRLFYSDYILKKRLDISVDWKYLLLFRSVFFHTFSTVLLFLSWQKKTFIKIMLINCSNTKRVKASIMCCVVHASEFIIFFFRQFLYFFKFLSFTDQSLLKWELVLIIAHIRRNFSRDTSTSFDRSSKC